MKIARRDAIALGLLLPVLGVAAAMLFVVPAVEEAFLYKAITFGSEAAEAQVVGVQGGELIVGFTPQGEESVVETVAPGDFDASDPPASVSVSYLESLPSYARLSGSFWFPKILYGVPVLALIVFLVMCHPSGPRAEVYRVRAEGREDPPGKGGMLRAWKPLLGLSVSGIGLGLMVYPVIRFTEYDIIASGALIPWFPAGFALLVWGGALAVVTTADLARIRGFRGSPAKRPWFFPKEAVALTVLVSALLLFLLLGVSFLRGDPELENAQKGEGVVVGFECRSLEARGCVEYVRVEYVAHGLMYREYVKMRHEGVEEGDLLGLEWSDADPSQVRESNP